MPQLHPSEANVIMDDCSPEALWISMVDDRGAQFEQRVYDRIVRLVPYWRVSMDAWSLSDNAHLAGIGVLRNYGGDLMVLAIDSSEDTRIGRLAAVLRGELALRNGRIENILVVFDDSVLRFEELPPALGQLNLLPWSSAMVLPRYVVKDNPC